MVYRYPLGNSLHPEALKEKQRSLREGFQTPLALRVHRALSWLRRAEAEDQDHDVRFILLWIGFNAAYAGDVEASASSSAPEGERGLFQAFFSNLVKFDARHRVYDAVWQRFSQEIRLLLENRYVYHPFWQHQNGAAGHADWDQTLKNRILLENYFLPGDLAAQIETFVEHYNHQRYHESLNNVTPADAYFGRAPAIIKQRERIKRKTIEHRRLQHRKLAA